jgi:hypothetical protein
MEVPSEAGTVSRNPVAGLRGRTNMIINRVKPQSAPIRLTQGGSLNGAMGAEAEFSYVLVHYNISSL